MVVILSLTITIGLEIPKAEEVAEVTVLDDEVVVVDAPKDVACATTSVTPDVGAAGTTGGGGGGVYPVKSPTAKLVKNMGSIDPLKVAWNEVVSNVAGISK